MSGKVLRKRGGVARIKRQGGKVCTAVRTGYSLRGCAVDIR
jgi:hypothetical protein